MTKFKVDPSVENKNILRATLLKTIPNNVKIGCEDVEIAGEKKQLSKNLGKGRSKKLQTKSNKKGKDGEGDEQDDEDADENNVDKDGHIDKKQRVEEYEQRRPTRAAKEKARALLSRSKKGSAEKDVEEVEEEEGEGEGEDEGEGEGEDEVDEDDDDDDEDDEYDEDESVKANDKSIDEIFAEDDFVDLASKKDTEHEEEDNEEGN